MLGIFQIPLEECEEMYRKLGSDVFKQNVIVGTVKMGWSHAFYDSEIWENILKLVCRTPSSFVPHIIMCLPSCKQSNQRLVQGLISFVLSLNPFLCFLQGTDG